MIPVIGGEGLALLKCRYWLVDLVPLHRTTLRTILRRTVTRVGKSQMGMAMAVMVLRQFLVAQLHVLVVVDTVAGRPGFFKGVRGNLTLMEDTTRRRTDRGYLRVYCPNVLASLRVHVNARLDVALASEFRKLLVGLKAELADLLVVFGRREACRFDIQLGQGIWSAKNDRLRSVADRHSPCRRSARRSHCSQSLGRA